MAQQAPTVIEQTSQSFSLTLGASRIIYTPDSKGQVFSVSNEQKFPILVQSQVSAAEGGDITASAARFNVIPPLFRLDGEQSAKLRVVHAGGGLPADRESLYWLCVKGIPPKAEDVWADGKAPTTAMLNVQVSVNNCIKLLVRPAAIGRELPQALVSKVTWKRQGNRLQAINSTPFYINLAAVSVGGKAVANLQHIAPFSSQSFDLPAGAKGNVEWLVINDLGGKGDLLHSVLD